MTYTYSNTKTGNAAKRADEWELAKKRFHSDVREHGLDHAEANFFAAKKAWLNTRVRPGD